MKTTITKKEKAIEIMKKMDIYKPYINGFEQKDKVRKINDFFFIDTSIFVGNDTDKRVFTPAYPLFQQIITFKLFCHIRCENANAQVPEPEAGVI